MSTDMFDDALSKGNKKMLVGGGVLAAASIGGYFIWRHYHNKKTATASAYGSSATAARMRSMLNKRRAIEATAIATQDGMYGSRESAAASSCTMNSNARVAAEASAAAMQANVLQGASAFKGSPFAAEVNEANSAGGAIRPAPEYVPEGANFTPENRLALYNDISPVPQNGQASLSSLMPAQWGTPGNNDASLGNTTFGFVPTREGWERFVGASGIARNPDMDRTTTGRHLGTPNLLRPQPPQPVTQTQFPFNDSPFRQTAVKQVTGAYGTNMPCMPTDFSSY